MATLAKDKIRTYESGPVDSLNDLPAVASDIIYEGSAVGDNASGYGRPLVAADPFLGFCKRRCENASGAAGDKNIKVIERGKVVLDVTGVTGPGDVGENVYASDDDTFTLTSTSNSAIGKVSRHISGTKCVVYFEAVQLRSI